MLVILAGILPILTAILVTGSDLRRKELQKVEEESRFMCRSLASQQEAISQGVKQLLYTLAELPEIQNMDATKCTIIFHNLLKNNNLYHSLALFNPEGEVVASGMPFDGSKTKDRKHFADAKKTLKFAAGEYVTAPINKTPVFPFALPVIDSSGLLIGILTTSLNLDRYYEQFRLTDMPSGTVFGVLDRNGVRLVQYPINDMTPVGGPISPKGWKEYSTNLEGHSEHEGTDGINRHYFSRQLRLTPDDDTYMVFAIAVPEFYITSQADAITFKYLAWLVLASSLSMITAFVLGKRNMVTPLNKLAHSAKRLKEGNLETRTGLTGFSGTIGFLAESFDDLVKTLQVREFARVESEIAQRESKERLRIIADNTYDWEYWRAPDGTYLWVSPSCKKISGYAAEDFIGISGRKISHIVHPDDRHKWTEHVHEIENLHADETELDFRIINKNGKLFWIGHTCKPIFSRNGSYLGRRGCNRDITERKIYELALQVSEARLRRAELVSKTGNWQLDISNKEVDASEGARRIYGLFDSPLDFETIKSIPLPEYRPRLDNLLLNLIHKGEQYSIDFKIKQFGSGKIIDVYSVAEYDKNCNTVFGIVQDISERKQTETILKHAKIQAEAATKAKSTFLANMSHEIRTPLNGILGMLQLLQSTETVDEQQEYVLTAIKSASRLTRLLSDILDLSRVEAGKLTLQEHVFDFKECLNSAIELFSAPAEEKGISLELLVDKNMPQFLIGDNNRLIQIVGNVVGNAIKFSENGIVRLEVLSIATNVINTVRVLFMISDTGIGISDEQIENLFQPFTQAENTYTRRFQGAGLGLSIVKHFVKMMNGVLAVDSTMGYGTTIYLSILFRLPVPK